jgi:hypothetical protein
MSSALNEFLVSPSRSKAEVFFNVGQLLRLRQPQKGIVWESQGQRGLGRFASAQQANQCDDNGRDKQQMDHVAGHTKPPSQEPENDKDHKDRPKHSSPRTVQGALSPCPLSEAASQEGVVQLWIAG